MTKNEVISLLKQVVDQQRSPLRDQVVHKLCSEVIEKDDFLSGINPIDLINLDVSLTCYRTDREEDVMNNHFRAILRQKITEFEGKIAPNAFRDNVAHAHKIFRNDFKF
jgi:hypothetical protein